MLILSRQRDETIMIGDDIEVTVVDIRGDKVRLGITAPKTVEVHRREVYDEIQRERRRAPRPQNGPILAEKTACQGGSDGRFDGVNEPTTPRHLGSPDGGVASPTPTGTTERIDKNTYAP